MHFQNETYRLLAEAYELSRQVRVLRVLLISLVDSIYSREGQPFEEPQPPGKEQRV